ncbi:MarR family transcriptional regulator [Streptomyces sp. PRKS01-29]|nr:helix-turn-helix domain-containing protein [Streptomyces sabulosicollis]MBI0294474.1 MarR family transcriptional regulator [Streptomyces sabulosicollis]
MNTTTEPLAADPDTIRAWLAPRFEAPGLVSICSKNNWTGIQTNDLDRAVNWVMTQDRAGAEGIYCRVTTVTSRFPAGTRGSARDSRALGGMWSDIDYGNSLHKATGLPADIDEARDIPRFAKLPEPTRVEHSGGGLYAWWEFDRPLVIGEDIDFDEAADLAGVWQNILANGAKSMGLSYGTGVRDLARVLRLPGTVNRKPGRVPVLCQVIEEAGHRYGLDEMRKLAEDLKPKPKKRTPPKTDAPRRKAPGTSGLGAARGPMEILGDHACCGEILMHVGATYAEQYPGSCSYCGSSCQRWNRPGWDETCSKDGIAVHKEGAAVTIRSDNFPGITAAAIGHVLSPGQLFAALHHGGDESEASRDIIRAAHGRDGATTAAHALPAAVLDDVRHATAREDDEPTEQPEPDTTVADEPEAPPAGSPAALLADFLEQLRKYVHLTDHGHVIFALAVAVSSDLDGEPLWGMLVGPPSGGKSEAVKALDDIADEHVDDITGPALLSWMPGKNPKPAGILTRIPSRAFVSISDFSTVLATSDRGGRDTLFALLRRAYDGHVVREVGNSPRPLTWTGRLTLLAAVTPAIDNFSSHTDALGPRWLYCRLPETDNAHKKATVRKRRKIDGLAEMQAEARRRASALVRAARDAVTDVELDDEMYDQLEDAAMLTCLGRAAVPRHAYGKREIDGIPVIEEPARVTGQIVSLAKSLLALGVPRGQALALAGKCALDTVPQARLQILRQLAQGEPLTVSEVRRRTGLNRHVARRALEDMEVLDLTTCLRSQQDEETEETGFPSTNPWQLGAEKALVVRVFDAQTATEQESDSEGSPLARSVGYQTPTPQKRGVDDQETSSSEGSGTRATHTSGQATPQAAPPPEPEDVGLWDVPLEEPDDYWAEAS